LNLLLDHFSGKVGSIQTNYHFVYKPVSSTSTNSIIESAYFLLLIRKGCTNIYKGSAVEILKLVLVLMLA